MNSAFVDTWYFVALFNTGDVHHEAALKLSQAPARPLITTEFVLLELANAMSQARSRAQFKSLSMKLEANPLWRVVPISRDLYLRGRTLFDNRPDKDWSLTDCTSFVVMGEEAIVEAFTADHHFRQAGFRCLLLL